MSEFVPRIDDDGNYVKVASAMSRLDAEDDSEECLVMARTKDIYVPPGGPGATPPLSPEIYASMGEAGVFAMLEAFYRELGDSSIRGLFADDMIEASKRSAAFYVQVLGGPPIYNTTYGNPMMRRRHFPFEIDEAKRLIWRDCFYRVLETAPEQFGFPAKYLETFKTWLDGFSKWMVNVAPDSDDGDTGNTGI